MGSRVVECRGDNLPHARVLLESAQILLNFLLAPVHRADEFAADDALAVNDVGLGKFEGAVARSDRRFDTAADVLSGIADREQINAVIFQKLVIVVGIVVHADREHGHTFVPHFILHLNERGHLFDTWRTPGGPEIQDDDFPPELT